jgi:nitroimidazol reductase NimA-like FMN-containing flavoprotein (pyridoxamine 5'-phosphate oxidase superfamily)
MPKFDVEKVIREYIDKSLHMSMATVSGNKPWVSEVHFVYDDNLNLYWRSLASRRHSKDIMSNPSVAGNIVRQHSLEEYPHAIYFEGTAQHLSNEDLIRQILPLFIERIGADDTAAEESKREDGHQFYKVTVENWYAFGKFDGDQGLKYKLTWDGGKKPIQ